MAIQPHPNNRVAIPMAVLLILAIGIGAFYLNKEINPPTPTNSTTTTEQNTYTNTKYNYTLEYSKKYQIVSSHEFQNTEITPTADEVMVLDKNIDANDPSGTYIFFLSQPPSIQPNAAFVTAQNVEDLINKPTGPDETPFNRTVTPVTINGLQMFTFEFSEDLTTYYFMSPNGTNFAATVRKGTEAESIIDSLAFGKTTTLNDPTGTYSIQLPNNWLYQKFDRSLGGMPADSRMNFTAKKAAAEYTVKYGINGETALYLAGSSLHSNVTVSPKDWYKQEVDLSIGEIEQEITINGYSAFYIKSVSSYTDHYYVVKHNQSVAFFHFREKQNFADGDSQNHSAYLEEYKTIVHSVRFNK